jgi:hypothetical protein
MMGLPTAALAAEQAKTPGFLCVAVIDAPWPAEAAKGMPRGQGHLRNRHCTYQFMPLPIGS